MGIAKSHIVQEIKRVAAANGGVPLGSALFAAETGIRQADWFGVHWARWGDALREAGFETNQLQGAYGKEHLLRKCAELALELGRIPVRGDLKLKRRQDPDFPSWNTFDRLGTKAGLVKELAEFCRTASGFDAVRVWCEERLQPVAGDVVQKARRHEDAIGYVHT